MAGYACQPQEAWEILVAVSQHANVVLVEVGEAVVAAATGEPMPTDLRKHLAAAYRHGKPNRSEGPPSSRQDSCHEVSSPAAGSVDRSPPPVDDLRAPAPRSWVGWVPSWALARPGSRP
ncbi:hypothetical protein [Streptomyces chartreusis]|uniref:hypothetical protein n=1 Tax=Streptomyces chartreusis TaxID=1969 RepID=UPI00365B9546